MADAFSVSPESLADAVAEMAEFQRAAESLLAEIESTVSNLHITWSGEAASAHAEAHRSWKHSAALMQEALNRLHAAGETAHGNYTGAMTTNQNMWS